MTTHEQTDQLRQVLSPELAAKYEAIVKERISHYIQGLILGMIIAYAVLYHVRTTGRFHRISLFFGITLFTTALYYLLMPKSDYMLNHLKTSPTSGAALRVNFVRAKTAEENAAWLSVYKTMKFRYLIGFVLGALAAIPLGNLLC